MTPPVPAALTASELAERIAERLKTHPEPAHVPTDAQLAATAALLLAAQSAT